MSEGVGDPTRSKEIDVCHHLLSLQCYFLFEIQSPFLLYIILVEQETIELIKEC